MNSKTKIVGFQFVVCSVQLTNFLFARSVLILILDALRGVKRQRKKTPNIHV